jgi:Predicted esterase of the alpha-beta hydrolase superfamily
MAESVKEKRYKIGLALSGGGSRGFAHPGAIKAIEDMGLKPDVIAGTSAGALAGAFYADGYTPEEIIQLFIGKEFKEFGEIQVPKMAIFGTDGFRRFLKRNLRAKNFEDLHIPLKVVTTNLDEGKSAIFEKGPIIDAVIASCSIPIIFNPVLIDEINYVDGGIFMNFPVSPLRSIADKIIGVNVNPIVSQKYNKTILGIAERSYHYMSRTNTLLDRRLCDVLVEMEDLIHFKTFDLVNSEKIFKIGYEHTQQILTQAISKNIFPDLSYTGNKEKALVSS